jgi:uncharacterized protein YecA (UPF0149 family)
MDKQSKSPMARFAVACILAQTPVPPRKGERVRGLHQAPRIQPGKPKVGRNDPCPCGSGKKFKHCHLEAK